MHTLNFISGYSLFFAGLLAVLAVLFFVIYIKLITLRNKVRESASDIDVQLKKRYDLIPNMLQMAAKFMEHEKTIMSEITKLRTEALNTSFFQNPQEKMQLESRLAAKLQDFKVSLENYPDLKSNQTMIQAMESMKDVEEHISAARRFYNSNVNHLRNAIEIFPSSMVAKWLNIKEENAVFFEISQVQKEPINSKDYFK